MEETTPTGCEASAILIYLRESHGSCISGLSEVVRRSWFLLFAGRKGEGVSQKIISRSSEEVVTSYVESLCLVNLGSTYKRSVERIDVLHATQFGLLTIDVSL